MFPLPLTLIVAPSKRLRHILIGLHAVALAAILHIDWPTHLQALFCLVLLASTAWRLRSMAPILLRCQENNQLAFQNNGEWTPAALFRQQTVVPGIVLLRYHLHENGPVWCHAIFPDSLPVGDFRRLRVWLRWMTKPEYPTYTSTIRP